MINDREEWMAMGTLITMPVPKTRAGYEAEIASYPCLDCQLIDRPSRLKMEFYRHTHGWMMLVGDTLSRHWIYGQCETCSNQLSLWKLRGRDK
jgi:hypothetical protein